MVAEGAVVAAEGIAEGLVEAGAGLMAAAGAGAVAEAAAVTLVSPSLSRTCVFAVKCCACLRLLQRVRSCDQAKSCQGKQDLSHVMFGSRHQPVSTDPGSATVTFIMQQSSCTVAECADNLEDQVHIKQFVIILSRLGCNSLDIFDGIGGRGGGRGGGRFGGGRGGGRDFKPKMRIDTGAGGSGKKVTFD